MNMKTTPTGNLSNLLNASQEYACALDDPKFREQMQGLKDVTAAIHGVAATKHEQGHQPVVRVGDIQGR